MSSEPRNRRAARRERHIEQLAGYEHGPDAPQRATEAALARVDDAGSVVVVEGISDQIAIETLAERLGTSLAEQRTVVVPIGGAQAIKHFVPRLTDRPGVRLLGLCDRAEAGHFASALGVAVEGDEARDTELERLGFFVCNPDLEAELIRSFDQHDLEALLEETGDLRSFRTLQRQPGWRDRPFAEQMHRWMRSVARRSSRYARLLVVQASMDRLPPPLLGLAERATR